MMIYILDTNIYRKLLDHFPKKGKSFEDIWANIDKGIHNDSLVSVDECYRELARHFDKKNENLIWIKDRKKMFLYPSNDESIIIREVFQSPKMRESVHNKNIIQNRPSADIYIVAKAKALNAIVVTTEEYKPHSAQLPNICEILNVQYISYDDFMSIIASF